jgi:geranylgeranyl pyrophosphate synthase
MYLDMIGKKTASLFRTAAIIGGYAAKADKKTIENLGEFGWKAGLAFQVMDDVLDVYGQSTGKEAAKDVIEHKLGNAAILVALRHLSKSRKSELLSILRSERVTKSMASKARALAVLTPAEYECRTVAMEYLDEAKKHLEVLEDSDYKRSLSQLADMVVLRTY